MSKNDFPGSDAREYNITQPGSLPSGRPKMDDAKRWEPWDPFQHYSAEELAELNELIAGAARILAKGISTRSELDPLTRLIVRIAKGDRAERDAEELRQSFEAIRKREDNMKAAAETAERALDELQDRHDDVLSELGRLRAQLAQLAP